MKTHSREAGFTLIELMIVVAIVAILSAVAYPSYKEYIAKGRRAEMKTVLLSAQQWMERFYTENYRYDKDSADANVALPDHLKVSPPQSGGKVYDIALGTGGDKTTRDTFVLKATPAGAMSGDKCGTYSVDQYGRKDLSSYSGFASKSAAMDYCWK